MNTAHSARRKRRVKRAFAVERRRMPPRVGERVDLPVKRRIAELDAPVVSARNALTMMNQHSADDFPVQKYRTVEVKDVGI